MTGKGSSKTQNASHEWLGVLSWHLVPKDLELLTRIRERDFENFIYEVVISIQFVQGLFEHFQLKIKDPSLPDH